jgi:glycosyltransferase involved in cell wall biosynthesis
MKILHVGKYYSPDKGGIESVTQAICENIINNSIEIKVLCFGSENNVEIINGIEIIRCKTHFTLFSQPFSISYLNFIFFNRSKFDLYHLHWPNILCIFFLFLKRKYIIHHHSDVVDKPFFRIFSPMIKLFYKKSRLNIATSENYMRHSYELSYSLHNKVIPLFINSQRSFIQKKLSDEINILTVGRLVSYKDHLTLIKSIEYLPKNYKINIVGSGPLEKKLYKIINIKNLNSRVKIFKNISNTELKKMYANADIFVLASNNKAEAFGVVLLEAMSFSLPLVTSNIRDSGVTFVNKDLNNGRWFEKGDPLDLAKKILSITEDKKVYETYSLNAYKRLHKNFQLKANIKKIESIYMQLK